MSTIDELTIELQTKAKGADESIESAAQQLEKLAASVGKINTGGLKDIGVGISALSKGMQGFKSVKMPDFVRLYKGLGKISDVDSTKLKSIADAINPLANSIKTLNGVNFDSKNITGLINSLTRLSNANVGSLEDVDFSRIGNAINSLTSSLQGAERVSSNTISITNAVAKLASAGAKADVVSASLPKLGNELRDFIQKVSGTSKVSQETIQFTQALGTLASTGNKAATTAGNLGLLATELKKFMQAMSTAPAVNSNIIQMTQALANLASQGGRVGSASNTISNGFKSIEVSGVRVPKVLKGMQNSFRTLFRSIAPFIGIYQVFGFLKQGTEYASDLAEVQNVVDVTFGNSKNVIEDFSKNAIKQFGISELAAKDTAGRFQAMGTAVGFSQSKMADMSVELTKLSADMASFYNVSQADVAKSLQSIFTGETEPMRRYGTDLTQATLQEWALKQGIDADMQSMSQAEKVMLRYQYVIANTGAATGDFARTSVSWANQVRILSEQFKVLGSVIGKGVIAAFKPFIQTLNNVMGKVITFSETVLNALGTIFGWKFEISAGGLPDDLGDSVGYTDDLASGAGDASDGYKDAAKNAKKLKDVVLGIDELNINAPDDGTSGTGGTSGKPSGGGLGDLGAGAGGGLNTNMFATDTVLEAYESSIDSLYKLGEHIRDTLIKTMDGIEWEKVYERTRGFGKGLADFLNGMLAYNGEGKTLFGQVGKTLANTLNTVVYFTLTFGQTFHFDQLGANVADGINTVFQNFEFEALAETLNVWVDGLWDFIGGFLEKIEPGDIFKGIKDFLGTLELDTLTVIVGAIAWKLGAGVLIKNALLALISKGIGKLTFSLTGVTLEKITFTGVAKALLGAMKNGLTKVVSNAGLIFEGLFSGLSLKDAFIATIGKTGTLIAGITVTVGGAITAISSFISMLTDGFSWLKEALMVVGIAITAVGTVILGAPATVAAVVAGIVAAIGTIVVVVKDNWNAIVDFFKGIPEALKNALENARKKVSSWGGNIAKTAKNVVNSVGKFFAELPEKIGYSLGVFTGTAIKTIGKVVIFFVELPSKIGESINIFITETLPMWIEKIKSFFTETIPQIIENVANFFGKLKDKIGERISLFITETLPQWINSIIIFFTEIIPSAIDSIAGFFGELPSKIWEAISNTGEWLWGKFGEFLSGFSKGIKDTLNIDITKAINDFGESASSLFSNIWKTITIIFSPVINFFSEKFTAAYNAVKSAFSFIGTWFQEKYKDVTGAFKNVKQYFKDAFQGAYDAVKKIWNGIGGYFRGIANDIITPIGKAVNGVINGVNWILDKVGSETRLSLWDVPKFATGTNGLPRDTIGVVNDQSGSTYKELIVPPSGKPFIPEGRNVVLPMEKGTKIMPAKQTKAFMNSMGINEMPHFAGGIGDFFGGMWEKVTSFTGEIWDYISHPSKIVQIAIDKFTDTSGWNGVFGNIASGAINTVFDSVVSYIKKLFDTAGGAGVEKAVRWAIGIANDDRHGYDQGNRWGNPDYDCSALVISAFEQAGIKMKSSGATYTGNMYGVAKNLGFADVTGSVNLGNAGGMKRGDILLNRKNHTAIYIGDGKVVQASSNEHGGIRGGKPGDQTGKEIAVGSYYNYPWDDVLRYVKGYKNGIGKISASDLFPRYEVGGFPEDGLFMANHNEVIGQFSNGRTAVANNYQIEEGIEEATYRGYMRAHAETRETTLLEEIRDAIREGRSISIDGREIVRAYDSRKARMGYPLKV